MKNRQINVILSSLIIYFSEVRDFVTIVWLAELNVLTPRTEKKL